MSPKVLLSDNTNVVRRLKEAVEHCTLPHVPQMIRKILETGAWRERYELGKIIRFNEFAEFITSKKPAGCGWNPEIVTSLLLKSEDADALKLWRAAMRAEAANDIDAKDKANQRPVGRPPKTETDNNTKDNVINSVKRQSPVGNSAAKALRVLRDNRPDIHARVLAGELSPHAGMVEAGFRKKVVRKKATTIERVLKLLPKLTPTERRHLRARLDELMKLRGAA